GFLLRARLPRGLGCSWWPRFTARTSSRWRRRSFQDHVKLTAPAGGVLDPDPSAVGHRDLLGDGQSKPGPGVGLVGDPKEAIEDLGVVFLRHPGALVQDAES